MSKLILLRHGQSLWNKANLFTGWVDVPLSPEGIDEALSAGEALKEIPIDVIFTTPLCRAMMTTMLAMSRHSSKHTPVVLHPGEGKMESWGKIYSEEARSRCIPVITTWELNERMYGELQGLNKDETRSKFGVDQVAVWRRSYDTAPPHGESLAMTAARSIPYFEETIIPHLDQGRNVLISAHGNSLRSIIMYLDGLTKDQVTKLEIPTGVPIFYEYHEGNFSKTVLPL